MDLAVATATFLVNEERYEKRVAARPAAHGWRAAGTSFLVLFAAKWGDLSQITTAGLVVRYGEPAAVFAGAWIALACVAALAVLSPVAPCSVGCRSGSSGGSLAPSSWSLH